MRNPRGTHSRNAAEGDTNNDWGASASQSPHVSFFGAETPGGKCHSKGYFSQLCPDGFCCQLETPSKRDPRLKNCLRQLGLWDGNEALSWLIMDIIRPSPLQEVPSLGGSGLYRKVAWALGQARKQYSSIVSVLLPASKLLPCFLLRMNYTLQDK